MFVLVVRGFHTPEFSFSNRADAIRLKTGAEINKKYYEIQVLLSSVNLRLKEKKMTSGGKNCLWLAGRRRCTMYSVMSIDQTLTLLASLRLSLALLGFEEFLGHSTP